MKALILILILTSTQAFAQEQKVETIEKGVKIDSPEFEANLEGLNEMARAFETPDVLQAKEENKELLGVDVSTEWDIVKNLPKDALDYVKSPLGWKKKEWFVASGVIAVTAAIMAGDQWIMDFVQKNKSELTKDISHAAEKGGSDGLVYGLSATYLTGAILNNKKLKQAALTAFSSMLVSGLAVRGLKNIFGRSRPYTGKGPGDFNAFCFCGADNESFPSGHTTSAFAAASAVSTVYSDNLLVKILAYTAATLTGLSRVHDKAHWASDVVMGAAIGHFTGKFMAKKVLNRNTENSAIQISPTNFTVGDQSAWGLRGEIKLDKLFKNKRK